MTDDYKPMNTNTLRARGKCCKSTCLHCPYGFTLKRHGLEFEEIKNVQDPRVVELVGPNAEILPKESFQLVRLKEVACALVKVNHLFVLEIFYYEGFEDQGLDKEVIESYFFY